MKKGGFTPATAPGKMKLKKTKGKEICGTCFHDVKMHVVVSSGPKGGTKTLRMECMEGDGRDGCLCFMDPVEFWKETLIEVGEVTVNRNAARRIPDPFGRKL